MEIILCQECANYLGNLSCQAFKKIPQEILNGENDHSKPLKIQEHDIVFEPKKIKKHINIVGKFVQIV